MSAGKTAAIYRVPGDLSAEVVIGMLANIVAEGATPLATVECRQELWRQGGAEARLAVQLNEIVNAYRGTVVPL